MSFHIKYLSIYYVPDIEDTTGNMCFCIHSLIFESGETNDNKRKLIVREKLSQIRVIEKSWKLCTPVPLDSALSVSSCGRPES